MYSDIVIDIETKALVNSGFTDVGISKIRIHINRYNPLRGSSYIPSPVWVANKKACIKIRNNNNKCFKYSVKCGVPGICDFDHPERMYHCKNTQKSDISIVWNIRYPVGNTEIDQFENFNIDISINVYRISPTSETILPHRLTEKQNAKYHIDLLLITNDGGINHCVYIKDFARLMNKQTN